jgi:hypothetical protein
MKTFFEATVEMENDQCYIYLQDHVGKKEVKTVRFAAVGLQLQKMGWIAVDFDDQGRVVGMDLKGFEFQH